MESSFGNSSSDGQVLCCSCFWTQDMMLVLGICPWNFNLGSSFSVQQKCSHILSLHAEIFIQNIFVCIEKLRENPASHNNYNQGQNVLQSTFSFIPKGMSNSQHISLFKNDLTFFFYLFQKAILHFIRYNNIPSVFHRVTKNRAQAIKVKHKVQIPKGAHKVGYNVQI